MYFEYQCKQHAEYRQQQLLAEAQQWRLLRLARPVRDARGPDSQAQLRRVGETAGPRAWRRAAGRVGSLLVRWGEALQAQAMPRSSHPTSAIRAG